MAYIKFLYNFNDFESLTVDNTNGGLTAATIAGKSHAHITVETAAIQYRLDGEDATVDGHEAAPGDIITLEGFTNLKNFRATRIGGTSAVLKVSYGKDKAI